MSAGSPKILYIAGSGRSGSTLVDRILGEVPGWFSCGELSLLWWNQRCSCRARVQECEFWGPVLKEVLGDRPDERSRELVALNDSSIRPSPLDVLAIARRRGRLRPASPHAEYASVLTRLYPAIARAAEARVVVDSSKGATYAYLIDSLTDLDLYVVHLVREPRATAHSWSRRKLKDPTGPPAPESYFQRIGPWRSSSNWACRNAAVEALLRRRPGRYLRVRYEDLVERPQEVIRSICAHVGEADAPLRFIRGRTVRLGAAHMVSGNPTRFGSGDRQIRADDEWTSAMDGRSKLLATLPAAPLMRRYGYTLSGRPRRART